MIILVITEKRRDDSERDESFEERFAVGKKQYMHSSW